MSDIATVNSSVGSSVTPASSASSNGFGGIADDFETFLTLLTTQLQNQDPLDPTDTNEFTNQLVAFSQVEQQIRSNQQLEDIADQLSLNNLAAKTGFLGQLARIEHDVGSHEGNGIRFQYQLNDAPTQTTLRVQDALGNTVFETGGETRQGLFDFTWGGIDQQGQPVAPGNYRLVVSARDEASNPVSSTVFVEDEIRELDGATGNFVIADGTFNENDLLRLIANGV